MSINIDKMDIKIGFEISVIVVEATRGRYASSNDNGFGDDRQTHSSILVVYIDLCLTHVWQTRHKPLSPETEGCLI